MIKLAQPVEIPHQKIDELRRIAAEYPDAIALLVEVWNQATFVALARKEPEGGSR